MLRQHEAGRCSAEMRLLDGQPRSADATAVTNAEGYVIGKKDFLALITQRPRTAEAVIRFLCAQLRDTTDRLETIALYDLNARVARFFLATLRQIHGSEMRKAPISG